MVSSSSGISTKLSIAVVDSIFEPGDSFRRYNKVGRKVKPPDVPTFEIDTIDNSEVSSGHGYNVLSLLTSFAQDPVYNFFMTVAYNDGTFDDRHMLYALSQLYEFRDEIDVVNISAGLDHISDSDKDCDEFGPKCAVCELTNKLLDEDIIIVAGAGNRPHTENVCCPSLQSDVISVGGAVAKCTASISPSSPHSNSPNPPNALWIERADGKGADGIYCSNRGCYPGAYCSDYRELVTWEGHPTTKTRKPDILAPLLLPVEDEIGPLLAVGTSYSTPLVAAGALNVVGMLLDEDQRPLAGQVRGAIARTGEDVEGSDAGLFNCYSFCNELLGSFGYEFDRDDDAWFEAGP